MAPALSESPVRKAARESASRQEELAKVVAIRGKVGASSFRFTDSQLLLLCEVVGSVGLACDCLLMVPRPRWLERWETDGDDLAM